MSICTKKISDFLGENFENSLNGVEKANRTFTDILITAAKTSLKQKRNTVSKHKKSKKWFNRECKESRKKFTTLSNLKNKNPCDPVLRQTCAETLKGYKNVCDKNRKQFWGSKINDLYNVSSDTNMWNVWKGCNDTVEDKSPALKNGKVWQQFYQNLFTKAPEHSVNYDMSVNTPKIGEMESKSLNNLTNLKELRKVLKKLKNGKAAGIDRVSNEMIKASFDILKPAYLKLFKLIITVGQVPAIWCKGFNHPST